MSIRHGNAVRKAGSTRPGPRWDEMEIRLRWALFQSEFKLRFQPQFAANGSTPVRFEALIRWHPHNGSPVAPLKFIPAAEKNGLIVPIGTWVIQEAVRRCAEWQTGELKGAGVAVNVSACQLAQNDFVEIVARALESTGLSPKLLELELTESVFIKKVGKTIRAMEELRKLGVTIALDDFGTGYSSLIYLQRLPIDALKMDRSFLIAAESGRRGTNVMKCVVELAHACGLRTVAEGAETAAQLELLRRLGCDEIQGFFLGRPSLEVVHFQVANQLKAVAAAAN